MRPDPPVSARPSWELADVLADRLRWYADCPRHPAASPDDDCPHCRDRAAYRLYVAGCQAAGRPPAAETSTP
jgi:hypothetical protein